MFKGYQWEYTVKDHLVTMVARNEAGDIIASHRDLSPAEVEEVLTSEARAMRIRAEDWTDA